MSKLLDWRMEITLARHRRGGHCPLTSTRTFNHNRLHRFFLPPWWNRLAVKPHLFLDSATLEYAHSLLPGQGSSAMKKRSFGPLPSRYIFLVLMLHFHGVAHGTCPVEGKSGGDFRNRDACEDRSRFTRITLARWNEAGLHLSLGLQDSKLQCNCPTPQVSLLVC